MSSSNGVKDPTKSALRAPGRWKFATAPANSNGHKSEAGNGVRSQNGDPKFFVATRRRNTLLMTSDGDSGWSTPVHLLQKA